MKKSRSKITKRSFGTYLIDAIAFALFLCSFFLELFKIIPNFIQTMIVVDIILILLPSIITIVSIVLSLIKEKIYGVTFNEFNRLRGFWFYSFSHMVMCLISLFAIYTISSLFGLSTSLLFIDLIAIFYSFYFSFQEIPLLLNNDRRLGVIIKSRYKNRDTSNSLGKQKDESILNTVLLNIILSEGIGTAYKTLCDKEDKQYNSILLDDLLDIQNRYFWDANDDIEFIRSNISGTYKNIDVIKAIDMGFSNIEELLEFRKDFDYKDIVSYQDETYQLTRSLFSLYRICENIGLTTKENKKLNDVANRLFLYRFSKDKNKSKPYSFISLMSVSTLSSGETWFLKSLRDSDHASYCLFSIDEQPIGLFLSILISYIVKNFPSSAEKLLAFINEPVGGLNGDGRTWKNHIFMSLEHARPDSIVKLLPLLLNIYESIQQSYFQNIFIKKSGVIEDYYGFSKEYIFNAWLEIILFDLPYHVDADAIEKEIEGLSEENKKCLAHFLPSKWIKDGALIQDSKFEFLNIFGDSSCKVEGGWLNEKIIKVLSKYHDKYFKFELDKHIKEINHDLDKIKTDLCSAFDFVKEDSLFDGEIDLTAEKELAYSLRIDGFDISGLIQAYVESIKESLTYSIRKLILEKATKENLIYLDDNYNLSSDSINKIQQLKPDYVSKNNYLRFDKTNKSILDEIRTSESKFLPSNFFGKNGTVSFNIQIDLKHTIVRTLTDEEIQHIIDKEYTMVNGLYKYSEMKNDEIRSVLVTKEELSDYISKSIIFAQLVFKQKIVLTSGKYLVVKKDNEDL